MGTNRRNELAAILETLILSATFRDVLIVPLSHPDPLPIPSELDNDPQAEHNHAHRCSTCGYVWEHGSEAGGDVPSHLCPTCGTGPHWFKEFPDDPDLPLPQLRRRKVPIR